MGNFIDDYNSVKELNNSFTNKEDAFKKVFEKYQNSNFLKAVKNKDTKKYYDYLENLNTRKRKIVIDAGIEKDILCMTSDYYYRAGYRFGTSHNAFQEVRKYKDGESLVNEFKIYFFILLSFSLMLVISGAFLYFNEPRKNIADIFPIFKFFAYLFFTFTSILVLPKILYDYKDFKPALNKVRKNLKYIEDIYWYYSQEEKFK